MKLGIDVSTLLEEEAEGAKYFDKGKEIDPLQEFRKNNVDLMRLRLWNDPYGDNGEPYLGGTSDLKSLLTIIKKTKGYGYKYIIDFHYSDFWVDPGKQMTPKAWRGLNLEELKKKAYEFTKESLLEVKKENVDVPYVQIGNEITNGMLWPIGQLIDQGEGKERTNYPNFIALLNSGISAAREVYPKTKIVIHLERSDCYQVYQELFSKLEEAKVDYDIIGMSYYPYWHGTFEQLFFNIDNCRKLFKKNVMIMELGYGFTLEDYLLTNNGTAQLKVNKENLEAQLPYDISVEGQALFIEDFISRCKQKELEGVIYWEPLWIPGENICWSSRSGQVYIHEEGKSMRNEWSNQCLFDYSGNKLPGFDKFKL